MYRTKKLTVTAMTAALLMAGGMSSAMASRGGGGDDDHKVTICHRTHSASNPWRQISVDEHAVQRHIDRHGDFVVDANHPCPPATTPPPPPPPSGEDGDGCTASSDSGDSTQSQHGLVNVGNINLGLNNLLGNALCQSNVGNGLAVALIGDAIAGGVGGSGDGDCTASSFSGDSDQDQDGAVNVGNLNVGGDNLLANTLCQSDVLNGLAVSLIGPALGGTSLLGGVEGILSGGPGFLLSGITTDVQVLANVLLQF